MTTFKIYSVDSAPEKSRPLLKAIQEKFGFVPNALGEIAESPAALKGYWEMFEASRHGNLSPVELRIMTNYVNHITQTPLDKAFEPNRVEERKGKSKDRASHAA